MSTTEDPKKVPEQADASTLFISLLIVPKPGEKTDDLSVTHANDTVITLVNSVGTFVTLTLVGSLDDGSFAGPQPTVLQQCDEATHKLVVVSEVVSEDGRNGLTRNDSKILRSDGSGKRVLEGKK